MKIKVSKELAYQSVQEVSEKEIEIFIEVFNGLTEMSQFQVEYLRHNIEALPPMFTALLKKFLTIELAKQQSLVEVSKMATDILKEFWAMRYGGKGGEA